MSLSCDFLSNKVRYKTRLCFVDVPKLRAEREDWGYKQKVSYRENEKEDIQYRRT